MQSIGMYLECSRCKHQKEHRLAWDDGNRSGYAAGLEAGRREEREWVARLLIREGSLWKMRGDGSMEKVLRDFVHENLGDHAGEKGGG